MSRRVLASSFLPLFTAATDSTGAYGNSSDNAVRRLRSNSVMQSFNLGAGLARVHSGTPTGAGEALVCNDGYMYKVGRKTKRMTRR